MRASPHYFETIGTKIVEGRANNEQDTPATRNIAVVNRFFEKRYFKDGHAIGKHFSDDMKHPNYFEIVGVTEDTNYWGPSQKMRPMYFLAQGQSVHSADPRYQKFEDRSQYLNAIEIETASNLPGLEAQVRRAVSQINPDLAIIDYRSFAAQVAQNFTQQAMIAKLTSFFGILALVLASVGLYGVTAYSVNAEPARSVFAWRWARNVRCAAAGAARGVPAGGHRFGHRHSGSDPGRPRDGEPVVRRQAL